MNGQRIAVLAGALALCAATPIAPDVTTLAGSGELGLRDGPARDASFLVPTGLAQSADGTIFVSDEAAQRIRAIRNGMVTTVAGSGSLGEFGFSVAGGYRDGPAPSAQFDHPTGIAIGPSGALFIADTKNACIRKLERGSVSTVLGKCGDPHVVDGDTFTARLLSPRSLAFDADGDCWIADFGGGLRRWHRGTLTTVASTTAHAADVLAVSASRDRTDPLVLAVTNGTLRIYHRATAVEEDLDTTYQEGGRRLGAPRQILALPHRQALFSDLAANNIRYLRLSNVPFLSVPFSRTIAGATFERGVDNAGDVDGTAGDSRFFGPRGLLLANGRLIVADAGNHKIRSIVMPATRLPEMGLSDDDRYDNAHYEIVLMGPSWTFWDSMGDDSICGQLERALDASGALPKPVRCHTVRIDSAKIPALQTYAANYLSFRHIDALVLMLNPHGVAEFPAAETDASTGIAAFRASMRRMLASDPPGSKLAVIWEYGNWVTSDSEDLAERETNFPFFPDDLHAIERADDAHAAAGLDGLGIPAYAMFADFSAYEKGRDALPLYGNPDTHLAVRGNAFLASHFAAFFLREVIGRK